MDLHSCDADSGKLGSIEEVNPDNSVKTCKHTLPQFYWFVICCIT